MISRLPEALFDLRLWDTLSLAECEHIARVVEAQLPSTFRFQCIKTYTQVDQTHNVAVFEWYDPQAPFLDYHDVHPDSRLKVAKKGSDEWWMCREAEQKEEYRRVSGKDANTYPDLFDQYTSAANQSFKHQKTLFALIPGMKKATLGYDRSQRFVPEETVLQEWQDARQTNAFYTKRLPLDYEAWFAYLDEYMTSWRTTTIAPFLFEIAPVTGRDFFDQTSILYFQVNDNKISIESLNQNTSLTHASIETYFRTQGFRLPSSDEWEYACKAGTGTFFYWGNDTPIIQRTYDVEDADLDGEQFPPKNAFGLVMPDTPYNWELCQERDILRGGDGGNCICGWMGDLQVCLTLAPAYIVKKQKEFISYAHMRRVYVLFTKRLPGKHVIK